MKYGDVFTTLAYLLSKADNDPLFLEKFTLKYGKLDNLVWADRTRVADYKYFGDVLPFDITYKKMSTISSYSYFQGPTTMAKQLSLDAPCFRMKGSKLSSGH
ncbi:hypothetical protein AHAS_Ahas01G0140300 [Arachis hypogaea]